MTRGQIAIIAKDDKVVTSMEFNGDMYMPTKEWKGLGQLAVNALKRTTDLATYLFEIARFNKNHHHYNDCVHIASEMGLETLDFSNKYFDNWFSDYVYIKNLTDREVAIKTAIHDEKGNKIGCEDSLLQPNQIAVVCFGELKKVF